MRNTELRRNFLLGLAPAAGLAAAAPADRAAAGRANFNVRDFGAAGDGAKLDTNAIQKAVDACSQAGGGSVWFPAGAYLSGTIVLKSHVMIHLDAGATLLGSKNLQDYPSHIPAFRSYTDTYTERSLIYAEGLENIGISGRGVLDGQGAAFKGPYKVRPYLMRFVSCRNISMTDITIRNSPMWVQHYLACDEVEIRGISVHSHVNGNNDGIDIDCSQRVRISDCEIDSGDDAIVLKATAGRPCKDVTVTNCVLRSTCNALKLGTESNGNFENIILSNCTVYDTGLAGIAIEMVDGGLLDRVVVSNVVMNGTGAPVFVRLGNRARPFTPDGPRPPMGKMRNIMISNVQAIGATKTGCSITGLPGQAVENVALDNIRLVFAGGGTAADAQRQVPENAEKYPEFGMFGTLPAYGLYCRHVKNLSLRNVETNYAAPDERPALVCNDVEGLEVTGGALAGPAGAKPVMHLTQVKDAFIHGCRSGTAPAWLHVSGSGSERVTLMGNELSGATKPVEVAPDVPRDAVVLLNNRVRQA